MPNISETVLHIRDEGLFVAHAVGHFIQDSIDTAPFYNVDDAIEECQGVFAGTGLMYAPTHVQAEAVVKCVLTRQHGKQYAVDQQYYDNLRDQVGSVIAFARDRYLRYNK